jgi:hypothetical protein
MIAVALAILAAVTLAPPFGRAAATAVEEGGYLAVTVEVDVDPSYAADYVVVHLLNPEGQETFPLGLSPAGSYIGEFTILPFTRAVVFEVGRAGEHTLSGTVSLLDLGLDHNLLQTTFRPPDPSNDSGQWGWLALGAGALAGAALLAWFVWPKPKVASHQLVDTTGQATVVDETDSAAG